MGNNGKKEMYPIIQAKINNVQNMSLRYRIINELVKCRCILGTIKQCVVTFSNKYGILQELVDLVIKEDCWQHMGSSCN